MIYINGIVLFQLSLFIQGTVQVSTLSEMSKLHSLATSLASNYGVKNINANLSCPRECHIVPNESIPGSILLATVIHE